jgi:hypothetical protein
MLAAFGVYLLLPVRIAELLSKAGLTVTARLEREPGAQEKPPQACLLARKPGSS